jgi:hypothetical protein
MVIRPNTIAADAITTIKDLKNLDGFVRAFSLTPPFVLP